MLVTVFFSHGGTPVYPDRLLVQFISVQVKKLHAPRAEHRHLSICNVYHIACMAQKGRDVRGDKVLAFPDACHKGAVLSHGHYSPWLGFAHGGYGISASNRAHRGPYGLGKRPAFGVFFYEVADDLGIGLACEEEPFAFKFLFELYVVLDDAVMDYNYPVRAVGVGVLLRGLAVRGPPCMAYCRGGTLTEIPELGVKLAYLALSPAHVYLAALKACDSG